MLLAARVLLAARACSPPVCSPCVAAAAVKLVGGVIAHRVGFFFGGVAGLADFVAAGFVVAALVRRRRRRAVSSPWRTAAPPRPYVACRSFGPGRRG